MKRTRLESVKYRKVAGLLALLLAFSVLLAACGDAAATATATAVPPTPTPTPDAPTIAKQATDRLNTVNTLHFIVDIKQGEVPIITGISFRRAEGDFSKPDSYHANMKVGVVIGQVDAEIIAVGPDQYITVKGLISNWQKLPADVGFKPAELFDSQKGLAAIIPKVRNLQIAGNETIDGADCWKLTGQADGKDLTVLTAGTLDKSQVDVTVWVGKSDQLIRQSTFKEVATDPNKGSLWQLNFSKFDAPVTINKPAGV